MGAVEQSISNLNRKPSCPGLLPQAGRGHRPLRFIGAVARDAGLETGDLS